MKINGPGTSIYPHVCSTGEIKAMLEDCENHIFAATKERTATSQPTYIDEPTTTLSDDEALLDRLELLEKVIHTKEGGTEMDEHYKLAKLFEETLTYRESGVVSVKVFKKLLKEAGIEKTPQTLVRQGWIIPITKEGQSKTGQYSPGKKLIDYFNAQKEKEPEGLEDKLNYLIQQRPIIEQEIAEVEARKADAIAEFDRMIEALEKEKARSKAAEEYAENITKL